MHVPKTAVTLVAAAVLGAAGGAAVVGVAGDGGGTTVTVTQPPAAQPHQRDVARDSGTALTASEVYAHAKDAVAFITASVATATPGPFGQPTPRRGESTGSGFVISSDGSIVTNAHVVGEARTVEVKIGDGDAQPARVVGTDPSTDIALLKVDATGLPALELGDSDRLAVGDPTYAIGNPFGLDRTLTTGVVSALQRSITAPNGFSISGVIQTDASINPGNSGGPLLDAQGRVIGVNSQILTGSPTSEGNVGIGFAVPSNTVANVVAQLEQDGTVQHAYLGVQMVDASDGDGARIAVVSAGGPAARAGLRPGDVVTTFDGEAVRDSAALSALVNARRVGQEVEVVVRRDGDERTLTVTLGKQPSRAGSATP